jgi:hypothetical protein
MTEAIALFELLLHKCWLSNNPKTQPDALDLLCSGPVVLIFLPCYLNFRVRETWQRRKKSEATTRHTKTKVTTTVRGVQHPRPSTVQQTPLTASTQLPLPASHRTGRRERVRGGSRPWEATLPVPAHRTAVAPLPRIMPAVARPLPPLMGRRPRLVMGQLLQRIMLGVAPIL